jgi:preprotein translocase SecE subunit
MAVDVARTGEPHQGWLAKVINWPAKVIAFIQSIPSTYRLIMNEMRRVTWPSVEEIRQLSVMVVILSLFIGGVIAIMDVTFQAVLVKWIPQLFAH